MSDFVPQNITGKFVGWVAQNEEASRRMNSAGPRFQLSEGLKLLPIARSLEDINVRLGIAGRLFAFQFLGHDTVMKLCFHRDRCRDVTVTKMIDKMIRFGVFPLLRLDGERFLTQLVGIALAQVREFDFGD